MPLSVQTSRRLLSIGEFAAATQLSPKALRLYDEQRLLQPARTDSVSGYRYYGSEQVALGRLIRTLRDMDLSLADVARVITAEGAQAELLLSQFATSLDHRYAREKRAFQSALLLLRETTRAEIVTVEERQRAALTAAVWPYMTNRIRFYEDLRRQIAASTDTLERAALRSLGVAYCRFIEPLSDEESPVELLIPVEAPARFPDDTTIRQLPPALCAVVTLAATNLQGADFSAPLDAIFDWFDRRGCRAVDSPCLARIDRDAEVQSEICWAYEPAANSSR
ncbi:MAG TPA: MerR family transcriptional regulator [Steroidobacteraceae bacterium]|nr:MerR family transcriptional regulator [Steroidobacteraceae bacterium]